MTKRKPNKMSTGDAVKILANEMKIVKNNQQVIIEQLNSNDMMLKDYIGLFERYIEHTEDGDEFVEKMKQMVDSKVQKLKEDNNEQQANEQVNGADTDGDKQDEGVGAEGVRAQEG